MFGAPVCGRFLLRYTTVWLDYVKKKGISLDVQDVLVHLIMHERD